MLFFFRSDGLPVEEFVFYLSQNPNVGQTITLVSQRNSYIH
jgi:hypothetical protein